MNGSGRGAIGMVMGMNMGMEDRMSMRMRRAMGGRRSCRVIRRFISWAMRMSAWGCRMNVRVVDHGRGRSTAIVGRRRRV